MIYGLSLIISQQQYLIMSSRLIYPICLILLISLFACHQDIAHSQSSSLRTSNLPSRNELFQSMRAQKQITYVYSAEVKAYQSFLDRVQHQRLRLGKEIVASDQINPDSLATKILFLIGSHQTNTVIQALSDKLPIRFQDAQFVFDSDTYNQPDDIIKLYVYPNPHNPKLPLYLLTGNDDKAILKFLEEKYEVNWGQLFWSSKGYEVYRNLQTQVMGYFNDSTWIMDKVVHFDFTNQVDTLHQTEHYKFIGKRSVIQQEKLLSMAQKCEAAFDQVVQFIDQPLQLPKINYHLYANMEEKGLQLSNTDISHCNFDKNCVFVIANDRINGQWEHPEHELLLRHLIGRPKTRALEMGLRLFFTDNWQGKGYQYWAKLLFQSGNLPQLKRLLNNKSFREGSSLVMNAASASFVDFLIREWGRGHFLKQYPVWTPSEKQIQSLEQKWRQFIQGYPEIYIKNNSEDHPYYKGFNFAHEGYRIYNGYGSNLAYQSLGKLAQIGSNSVAIVPYSYMRNPNEPTPLNLESNPGGENDESVVTAHFNAKKLGMMTLLKPQIWLGRSWPGDVAMNSEEKWQQFFEYYSDWIIHYALLAEMYEFDAFCIGVEFAKATIQRPEDWRKLIRRIRKLYSGKITYAANWGEEFEQLNFWDELDFIGINCYYPLSEADNPDKKELEKRFDAVLEKVEKVSKQYKKPVVFTEIGFRSVNTPWKNPHADAANRPFSEKAQSLCYEVVFEGIHNKDWCDGIFWWKWPSYLSYQGQKNTSFTPNRKMAEGTVEKWFKGSN